MRRDSGTGVVANLNKVRENGSVIFFLEIGLHIVSDLSNRVTDGVSDFVVAVVEILSNELDNGVHLFNIFNIFSNLTEGHEGSILVSPVGVLK